MDKIPNIKDFLVTRSNNGKGLFVTCDFSQLELCGLAEISGCEALQKDIRDGVDIHARSASQVLGIPIETVSKIQRRQAKSINFGLIYGAGPEKLAETSGLTVADAKKFIENFYRMYPGVRKFHDKLKKIRNDFTDNSSIILGHSRGPFSIDSITGRLYTITKKKNDRGEEYFPLTEMKNYPIQGYSTGDLVPIVANHVLVMISKAIEKHLLEPAYFVATVHDDFTLELSDCEDVYAVLQIIEHVFQNLHVIMKELFDFDIKVQYNYDVKIGTDFGSLTQYSRSEVLSLLEFEE